MNDTGSTLVAHCGARKVTRKELKEIPVPEATKTHQPLSHFEIVEVLEEALSFRYLKVVRDEYAVSQDGMKMFGVMDLDSGFDVGNFSIGLRNSNDKSMRLALTAGYRVLVCDNMAFSGDFTPLFHKHTKNLELRDSISIAVDRIQRGFDPLRKRIKEMQDFGLTDNDARLFIYRVFMERAIRGVPRNLMPEVHDHYFSPGHEEFRSRNLWSLSNAFTSAFKKLAPTKQFEVTARLGAYLSEVQEDQKEKLFSGMVALINEQAAQIDRLQSFAADAEGFRPFAAETDSSVSSDDEQVKQNITADDLDKTDDAELPGSSSDTDAYLDEKEEEMMEEFERRVAA